MAGVCIRCGNQKELIQSHVVSALLGKRIFPEPPMKAYTVRYGATPPGTTTPSSPAATRWRLAQDLPKPRLMCRACDGALSADEDALAKWLDTIGIAKKPGPIYDDACLKPTTLACLPDFREYNLPEEQANLVRRVALITAWRALHATAQSSSVPGSPSLVLQYLQSCRGKALHDTVTRFLDSPQAPVPGYLSVLVPPYPLTIAIAGKPDVAPFGWDVMLHPGGDGSTTYVVCLWFAHWLVLWVPDQPHGDPVVAELVAMTFMSRSAATWPMQVLAPRVQAAASAL